MGIESFDELINELSNYIKENEQKLTTFSEGLTVQDSKRIRRQSIEEFAQNINNILNKFIKDHNEKLINLRLGTYRHNLTDPNIGLINFITQLDGVDDADNYTIISRPLLKDLVNNYPLSKELRENIQVLLINKPDNYYLMYSQNLTWINQYKIIKTFSTVLDIILYLCKQDTILTKEIKSMLKSQMLNSKLFLPIANKINIHGLYDIPDINTKANEINNKAALINALTR